MEMEAAMAGSAADALSKYRSKECVQAAKPQHDVDLGQDSPFERKREAKEKGKPVSPKLWKLRPFTDTELIPKSFLQRQTSPESPFWSQTPFS